MAKNDKVIIYNTADGPAIEVRLEDETVWLSQKQMAELFDKDVRTINEHIKNIFKEGELDAHSVIRNFRITASDGKNYNTNFYNLDVIISVGYRVKSIRGTQFRIWATRVLREHLVKGFTLNPSRVNEKLLSDLREALAMIRASIHTPMLTASEMQGMLELIERYALVWQWIHQYDSNTLPLPPTRKETRPITISEARMSIGMLKDYLIKKQEASDLFGLERDTNLFDSALNTIYQTFGGTELYPSFEEKAAHLLYFIIKNHPFVDGNKRIGALLFIQFVYQNISRDKLLEKFNNNALTALCYLVAGSPQEQKDQLVRLIMHFLTYEEKETLC
ncbi:MAG TPA: virulence protein RhuM/Fic/DOC family protein [Bacteroidales bacterium]|nr:virulence protein RhuM/Fic/DOC family protein [Victivallales bacterium]HOK75911.1 virulence protein RhuM/Fic/DOC family protein [Bacteroidales bacterium]HPO90426.1 virulence protein RhuM/Fic/DOC family protein [Victivallales bacterium]